MYPLRKFNDRLLNYPSRRKIKIKTGSEITRASFLVGVIRNNPKNKGNENFTFSGRIEEDEGSLGRAQARVSQATLSVVRGQGGHPRLDYPSWRQTEPRSIATPFLQMHTAEMCHWRGNMVEARVPRALSSIRYDTLTFLRCRMRKTMAAASWINDTDPGRWGRPSVNFLRSSEPP